MRLPHTPSPPPAERKLPIRHEKPRIGQRYLARLTRRKTVLAPRCPTTDHDLTPLNVTHRDQPLTPKRRDGRPKHGGHRGTRAHGDQVLEGIGENAHRSALLLGNHCPDYQKDTPDHGPPPKGTDPHTDAPIGHVPLLNHPERL